MAEASSRFLEALADVNIERPAGIVLSNTDASSHTGGQVSAEHLAWQLSSPIKWVNIVAALEANGVGVAIDVGPKGILASLVSKTTPRIRLRSLNQCSDVEKIVKELDLAGIDPERILERCLRTAVTTRSMRSAAADKVVALARDLERLRPTDDGQLTLDGASQAISVTIALLREKGYSDNAVRVRVAAILDVSAAGGA
jgi:[acyl-carrier-protein] S-malonyltransferase